MTITIHTVRAIATARDLSDKAWDDAIESETNDATCTRLARASAACEDSYEEALDAAIRDNGALCRSHIEAALRAEQAFGIDPYAQKALDSLE